jgi:hypothetical protein
MEKFTVLNVYDGWLRERCMMYDAFILLVKGTMTPEEVARFDSYIRTQYKIHKGKLEAHKLATEYLNDHGFTVLQPYINEIDFSSERRE